MSDVPPNPLKSPILIVLLIVVVEGVPHLHEMRKAREELEKPVILKFRLEASDAHLARSSARREADREVLIPRSRGPT
jgi:hypothetical protein